MEGRMEGKRKRKMRGKGGVRAVAGVAVYLVSR